MKFRNVFSGPEEDPASALAELVSWKSLKYLNLQDTKITEEGVAALREANPVW
jgi:hypothetical protein